MEYYIKYKNIVLSYRTHYRAYFLGLVLTFRHCFTFKTRNQCLWLIINTQYKHRPLWHRQSLYRRNPLQIWALPSGPRIRRVSALFHVAVLQSAIKTRCNWARKEIKLWNTWILKKPEYSCIFLLWPDWSVEDEWGEHPEDDDHDGDPPQVGRPEQVQERGLRPRDKGQDSTSSVLGLAFWQKEI